MIDLTIREIIHRFGTYGLEAENMALRLRIEQQKVKLLEEKVKDLKRINGIYRYHLIKEERWID